MDGKLFNEKLVTLCQSITDINNKIVQASQPFIPAAQENAESIPSYAPPAPAEIINNTPADAAPNFQAEVMPENNFAVSCPPGMEMIPPNYKQCFCGYKNRAEANYCGKCGSKLP